MKARYLSIIIIAIISLTALNKAEAREFSDTDFPRLANYYLVSGVAEENYDDLAKYDLLIFPMENQYYDVELFNYLREQNPDIIIMPYVPSQSINVYGLDDPANIRQKLYDGIEEDWYLKDSSGNQVSTWTDTYTINVTKEWNSYLPQFVYDEILATGLWDGIFYDMVWDKISWVNEGDVDLDQDGQIDNPDLADAQWREGMVELFDNTRDLVGEEYLVIINGTNESSYQPYLNGRMFESFPVPWEGDGSWDYNMHYYKSLSENAYYWPVFIVNSNSNDTGVNTDYQKVRYGLTSTLLYNGYYSFDHGITSHAQIWWYDEYEAYLGQPLNQAYNLTNNNSTEIGIGVWRRDFTKGFVLVNTSGKEQTIYFEDGYEKINGEQDPDHNDGNIVNSVRLLNNDGIILLRRISDLKKAAYDNGYYANIFNDQGEPARVGFFAYDSRFTGGNKIIKVDLENNGSEETVVARDSDVLIYNSASKLIARWYPYNHNFDKGINITIGDLDNDGDQEIITGTENGGGPHVRIFNHQGRLIHPGFFAYASNFRGGANVAAGDLNGDGVMEIIVGAGNGGGPHIRVFNKDGRLINPGFFAYDKRFRGGVNVAVGDINNDGKAEIVSGSGPGGGPHVRIFDKDGRLLNPGFFAYDKSRRDGVQVQVTDVEGDGQDEIIALIPSILTQ